MTSTGPPAALAPVSALCSMDTTHRHVDIFAGHGLFLASQIDRRPFQLMKKSIDLRRRRNFSERIDLLLLRLSAEWVDCSAFSGT